MPDPMRQRRGYNGATVNSLRDKKLRVRPQAGTAEAVHAPSQEAVRGCIEALICPFCGRGPFVILAGHTNKIHGVDRLELRDLAGLTYSASITPAWIHEQYAERARKFGRHFPPGHHAATASPRRLSLAAKQTNREKLRAASSDEQRRAAARASARVKSRAHTCTAPRCHNLIGRSTPKTCSPTCRLAVRVATGARANAAVTAANDARNQAIRAALANGETQRIIAARYGLTQGAVSHINIGR